MYFHMMHVHTCGVTSCYVAVQLFHMRRIRCAESLHHALSLLYTCQEQTILFPIPVVSNEIYSSHLTRTYSGAISVHPPCTHTNTLVGCQEQCANTPQRGRTLLSKTPCTRMNIVAALANQACTELCTLGAQQSLCLGPPQTLSLQLYSSAYFYAPTSQKATCIGGVLSVNDSQSCITLILPIHDKRPRYYIFFHYMTHS